MRWMELTVCRGAHQNRVVGPLALLHAERSFMQPVSACAARTRFDRQSTFDVLSLSGGELTVPQRSSEPPGPAESMLLGVPA